MSLDVSLICTDLIATETGPIYIRENGRMRNVTRKEWDERFPEWEPITFRNYPIRVFEANITHNLNRMAEEAGIYKHLWRPEEIDISTASQLIEPLKLGLKLLMDSPEKFKSFNPENGWGSYECLVEFVAEYIAACQKYPNARIDVSR